MESGHEKSMEEDIEPVRGNQDKEGKFNSVKASGMTSTVPKKMDVPMGGTLTPGDTSQAKLGSTQELGSEELLIPNESQFVVHGREGRYLMEKSKWPKLMLASETNAPDSEGVEVLTQEETLVSQAASQGGSAPTLDPPGC